MGEGAMNEQHVYHHSDLDGPRISVKVERNSRGYNWEASVSGARDAAEAISLLREAEEKLRESWGAGGQGVTSP